MLTAQVHLTSISSTLASIC